MYHTLEFSISNHTSKLLKSNLRFESASQFFYLSQIQGRRRLPLELRACGAPINSLALSHSYPLFLEGEGGGPPHPSLIEPILVLIERR